jgi:hypothetical protein
MVGHRGVAVVTAYVVLMAPFWAHAQCKADVDCKGDRICENGQCVDPRTKKADPPPSVVPPPPPPEEKKEQPKEQTKEEDGVKVTIRDAGDPVEDEETTAGWALPAGIIGLVSGVGVLGLSIGSALTSDEFSSTPSVPLGIAALVLLAAAGPIVFVGGGSARRAAGATGLVGLRIAGWIAYGISILVGAYLLLFTALGTIDIPAWPIVVDGAFGTLAMALFATDALVAHGEASEGAISQGPSLVPSLVMARESSGAAVPGIGISGRF